MKSLSRRIGVAHSGSHSAAVHARLAALPRSQQLVILELAAGATVAEASRRTGVPRRTLTRWTADRAFQSIREDLTRQVNAEQVRMALAALFDVIEKERRKGISKSARYILDRTIFASQASG